MNLQTEQVVSRLNDSGVVPLDEIFGLTEQGVDYSVLDDKYNVTN